MVVAAAPSSAPAPRPPRRALPVRSGAAAPAGDDGVGPGRRELGGRRAGERGRRGPALAPTAREPRISLSGRLGLPCRARRSGERAAGPGRAGPRSPQGCGRGGADGPNGAKPGGSPSRRAWGCHGDCPGFGDWSPVGTKPATLDAGTCFGDLAAGIGGCLAPGKVESFAQVTSARALFVLSRNVLRRSSLAGCLASRVRREN